MDGFNPNMKVGPYGEAVPIIPENETETTREFSIEERLSILSASERKMLLADALERGRDIHALISAINRVDTATPEDYLF